ncbi:MAG TPA: aminotransferase class V-fold PLP-dependent enzyme [Nitrosopumilaceae archaeon]|nr:aminotransferase class V-fold PLP-dependent enzyme [Nitrosopumilaceae archaeon]
MNLDYNVAQDFPYKSRIYLNNASTSLMPISSIKAMTDFLVTYNESGPDSSTADSLVREKLLLIRKAISHLIKCKPEEIILTQSTTDGINMVASGLNLKSSSNIVIRGSNHEHPANHYPWVRLSRKIDVRNLQIDENGFFDLNHLEHTIDDNTGLIVLSHALFNTGAILPVEQIGKLLVEKNIPFFIDSAQTVGCIEDVDVNKINCNFMSFNGSKWLCGPMGMGVFYCKKESSELLEPLQVGGESANFYEGKITHKETPAKFQAGFRNWSGVAGLEASIVYLLRLGLDGIRKKNIKLANLLRDELSKVSSITLYGPEEPEKRTSIVSFSLQGQDSKIVVEKLEKQNMVLAEREIINKKVIRASMHFFNTESEILKVVEAIKKL